MDKGTGTCVVMDTGTGTGIDMETGTGTGIDMDTGTSTGAGMDTGTGTGRQGINTDTDTSTDTVRQGTDMDTDTGTYTSRQGIDMDTQRHRHRKIMVTCTQQFTYVTVQVTAKLFCNAYLRHNVACSETAARLNTVLLQPATRDSHLKGLTTLLNLVSIFVPFPFTVVVMGIARALKDSRYCNLCVDQQSIKTHVPFPTAPLGCGLAMTCNLVNLRYLILVSHLPTTPYRHLHSHKKISFNTFSSAKHGQQKVYRHFKDNVSVIPADLQDMFYLFLSTQKHIPSIRIFHGKLTLPRFVKQISIFMDSTLLYRPRAHTSPPHVLILSQNNPFHSILLHILQSYFNIILQSIARSSK